MTAMVSSNNQIMGVPDLNLKVDEDLPCAAVQLLRPDEDGIHSIINLLTKVPASYKLDDLAGSVTVATPRRIRTRKI
jgi:hypothetical protein